MKQKWFAGFLALCLTLTLLPPTARAAEIVDSGECGAEGDNVTWTLDDAGVLTISGFGAIAHYGAILSPWYSYRDNIKMVTIEDSVSSIGHYAFRDCTNLTSITITDNVNFIGDYAFIGCTSLTSVTIPDNVISIGLSTFSGCTSLTSIIIPDGVNFIGNLAFNNCVNLTSIIIPANMELIYPYVFYNCTSLADVYFWGNETQWKKITVGNNNDPLEEATIWYPGPAKLNIEQENTDTGMKVTVTSDRPLSSPLDKNSISVDVGTTELELDSTVLDGNKTLVLSFTGESKGGEMQIKLDSTAFVGPKGFTTAEPLDVKVPAFSLDPKPEPEPENPDPENPETPDPETPDPETPDPETPGTEPPETPDPETPDSPTPEPIPDETPVYVPPATPTYPVQTPSGGASSSKDAPAVSVDDPVLTYEPPAVSITGAGEPAMQYIVKDTEHVRWVDRADLPRYALTLYQALVTGSDGDHVSDILIEDHDLTLPAASGSGDAKVEVESVLTLAADLGGAYASGSGGTVRAARFNEDFAVIDADSGDRAIDYASLKEGDVVRTSSHNAIFVTSLRKDGNDNFDAALLEAAAYAFTSFQAFDRDCPEVFWLSGKMKLRMVTVTTRAGGETYQEMYIFFTLVDSDGFTVRDSAYPDQASIEDGIARRDAAVERILSTVTGTTPDEQVTQLNRWLTEHNHYNTSEDLLNLPNAPHECLSALEGNIGTLGPVCDGYSRAFKVLCDRLEIPCVLVDGYAVIQAGSPEEFHMWNAVQMSDGQWYGVDVTWNDPMAAGVEDAKSGREREDFLLVGAETVVLGLKFSVSHPPRNQAADGGVCFTNGPSLSVTAFQPLAAATVLPFADVSENSWYYDSVRYVYEQGLMVGTGTDTFSPGQSLTRAMAWTFLARLAGEDIAGGTPWYAGAQSWASGAGISDGADPDGAVTRQQLVTMLWRYAGAPASGGSLDAFADNGTVSSYAADALCWAVECGIISGINGGTILPDGTADRAQVAAILERFCQL